MINEAPTIEDLKLMREITEEVRKKKYKSQKKNTPVEPEKEDSEETEEV